MNNKDTTPEVWMRGPVRGIPPILQPLALVLLQVQEDIAELIQADLEKHLWIKPFGLASIGFHLQHIPGVIDRMMSYAMGRMLTTVQFEYLRKEGAPQQPAQTIAKLKTGVASTITAVLDQLKTLSDTNLTEIRYLGRKRISTTQIDLLFHAADHAQRHYGQLLVTVNLIRKMPNGLPPDTAVN